MSSPGRIPERRRPWLLPVLLFLLLGTAGGTVYFVWLRPKPQPQPDLMGAMAANTRGVARMERFEYPLAAEEFEEAVRLAPDWTPAKVNLGISLLNQQDPKEKTQAAAPVKRAEELFKEILAKEPDNKHAHYCLGIIAYYFGRLNEAYPHFEAVSKLDPDDANTWIWTGASHPDGAHSPGATACYERALKLNPNLNEARYRLAQRLLDTDPARGKQLLQEHTVYLESQQFPETGIKYAEMGKYGDVIGHDPSVAGKPLIGPIPMFDSPADFKVTLAAGARWATPADLDPVRRGLRGRFGGTIMLFDYNRDGKPDLFLTSAVVENGKVRDLLLRNDGNHTFTDVTAEAGLATPRPSLGAAAGDYDNDGFPDLVVTGFGEQHLFRNKGSGSFEDVSAAGLDKEKGVCLGCGWVDLDQDADLDLILCRYGDITDPALPATSPKNGGLLVFENIGEAKPGQQNAPQPPLTTKFRKDDRVTKAVGECAAVSFVAADFDGDYDLDLLVLADSATPILVENDRLMRFHRTTPSWAADMANPWNGGLVFSASHADRSDLFLLRADIPPVFLLAKGRRDFTPGNTNSPALKQAVAVDLDLDGWTDVVGLTAEGKPTLLHNQGDGRLEHKPGAFGEVPTASAVACADLDGDGNPDVLLWSDSGLSLRRNMGNGNNVVMVDPTGTRNQGTSPPQRTNSDGIGCWIVAQAGPHWTAAERTTTSAGLGQSLLPTALGMGKAGQADALRLRWPDGSIQAEIGIKTGVVSRIAEVNRKETSCPVLLTWDGEKFAFVTDFLGAGSMGESGPDGSTRPPRPEESVKIEPGQLVPKNGRYLLKIAEPMDEILYLDHLRLDVIDHPADVSVYPDERFVTSGPQPSRELLAFRSRFFPKRATDHRDRDVTKLILDRDRRAVDGFALRSWIGFAEHHSLTLDFGDVPMSEGRWFLVLAGWTEYAYPESIYAAERAGIPLDFPVLEKLGADGKTWESLGDLGFPAGLPRVMTVELKKPAGGLTSPGSPLKLRIRTNMQVYWDQIFLARAEDAGRVGKVTTLDVMRADLAYRGFMQEIHPDGRPPIAYDDSKTESVPVTKWKGNLTRTGDVTDLLRAADDRFVICGPGDEITVGFDATKVPELPAGWKRSFVLQTRGYCKDSAPTTVTGGQVGPLPFRAMTNYPDFGGVKPPVTDADRWQTRPASGR